MNASIGIIGGSTQHGAGPGAASADCAGLCSGGAEQDGGSADSPRSGDGRQVARALCRAASRWSAGRAASGAPRTLEDEQIEAVIVRTLESLPPEATHWSSRGLSPACGLSVSTVQLYWLRLDLTDGVGSFSRCGCRPWSSGHEFLLC